MVKKYNPIFKFNEELTEGIITKRKGQFIFYVLPNNRRSWRNNI